jgi:hypothetical protein
LRESPPSSSTRHHRPPNNGGDKFGSELDDGKHGVVGMTAVWLKINRQVKKSGFAGAGMADCNCPMDRAYFAVG